MADFVLYYIKAENAIAFDGGGSSTMVINGSVVNVPSDGSERLVPNALMLIKKPSTSRLPLLDNFTSAGRSLAWDEKFSYNPIVVAPSTPPAGDGYVLKVDNENGEFETVSVGAHGGEDYRIEAWVYCDYKSTQPDEAFQRVGIFARDNGNANFDSVSLGGGNCYAMTFDTDTGRIRAAKVVDGTLTDYMDSAPVYKTISAWRRFTIECIGSDISFFLDGEELARVTDITHSNGRAGLGYHDYSPMPGSGGGGFFENFSMKIAPSPSTVYSFWNL
jgi:hypothetical protein